MSEVPSPAPAPSWDRTTPVLRCGSSPPCQPTEHHRGLVLRQQPIAIVDDDPSVCDSLMVLLETMGFEALSYTSGVEFLRDGERHGLGCLIIDQNMPEIAGLDVLAALGHEGTAPPAILITGRLDGAIADRADKLGVAAVLEKPFSASRLVELIRRAQDGAC